MMKEQELEPSTNLYGLFRFYHIAEGNHKAILKVNSLNL